MILLKKSMVSALVIFMSFVTIGCVFSSAQSTATSVPTPSRGAVDLSQPLNEYRDKKARISFDLMPTLTEEYERKEFYADASMLIDLLLADPIYFSTYSNNAGDVGVSVHIDGGSVGSFVYMVLETDRTISIRFDEENYRSVSGALYDKVLELAQVKDFNSEDLFDVQSVKLSHKQKSGKIKTVVITDKNKIEKLAALMYTANVGMSHECFSKPDVKVTFQKEDGDIVCHLYSEPIGDVDKDVVVNRLTFYAGYAFVDYVRSLL